MTTSDHKSALYEKLRFSKESTWHRSKLEQVGANVSKMDFRAFM